MATVRQQRFVGAPMPRVEDARLLTGRGTYVDDVRRPGTLHAAFVRSDTAHGHLVGLDLEAASEMPGVVAVLSARHLEPLTDPILALNALADYRPAPTPILASDRVRFVGEPLAIVIARDRYLAEDAAAAVGVDVEPLPAISTIAGALEPGACELHEGVPGNVWATMSEGRGDARGALAAAPHRLELEVEMQRCSPAPLEGRAILADLSADDDAGTIWVTSQGPHFLRTGLARALRLGEQQLRVISPDVGGGFGAKLPLYPEYVAVAAASRLLRRPVRWTSDRREELLTAAQAREQVHRVQAGFDDEGRVLGLQLDISADAGAYSVWPETAALEGADSWECLPGPYDIEHVGATVVSVATNKAAVGPYRGVGRTMTCMTLEHLMDEVARRTGVDPLTVRARNVARVFPHVLPSGVTVAVASFAESIDVLREALAPDLEEARLQVAQGNPIRVGVGVALAIEPAAPGRVIGGFGADIMIGYETATVRVEADGRAMVTVGTHSHGQGHETTMAQIAADVLGIDALAISVLQGDTAVVAYGGGTWASRSAVIGGGAVTRAAERVVERGRLVAATLLDVAPDDVRFSDGRFVAGEREVGWLEVGYRANLDAHQLPEHIEPGLEAVARYYGPDDGTVSNRAHAAVVEVDTETGDVRVRRYIAVEDCGRMINPLVVRGQIQGGIAQGIGNAIFEQLPYDANGQPLATTLLDYLMPTADTVPPIEILHLETPLDSTIHGIKGMGEGGAIPPPAAILNAVNNAISPLGATLSRTPITPDAVSCAIVDAAAARGD